MTADDRQSDDPASHEPTDETEPTSAMTDTTPNESDDDRTASLGGTSPTPGGTDTSQQDTADESGLDRLETDRLRAILDRVGLAALVLLALVAGWSFYGQAGTAIRTWLDPAYQPLALAAFNFAVLLVAIAGIVHQLARIRASE